MRDDQSIKVAALAGAWGNLGMILLGCQFQPEAAACFSRAERLADKDARWPFLRAVAVQRTDPETAIAELRRALKLGGDYAGVARLRLGDLLLEQGRLDEAKSEFEEALTANPDDARTISDSLGWKISVTIRRSVSPTWSVQPPIPMRERRPRLMAEVHQRLGDAAAAADDLRTANNLPAGRAVA